MVYRNYWVNEIFDDGIIWRKRKVMVGNWEWWRVFCLEWKNLCDSRGFCKGWLGDQNYIEIDKCPWAPSVQRSKQKESCPVLGPYGAWIGPPALTTLFQRDGEQINQIRCYTSCVCVYHHRPMFLVKMHIYHFLKTMFCKLFMERKWKEFLCFFLIRIGISKHVTGLFKMIKSYLDLFLINSSHQN